MKTKNKLSKQVAEDFFLPDLCSGQPVYILVLVAELLAIVLVLSASGLAPFDWHKLALTSIFTQWVVLTSAGMICLMRPYLQRIRKSWAAAEVYTLILVDVLVFSLAAEWVLAGGPRADFMAFVRTINGADILRNLLIGGIIGGLILRYFIVQAQLRTQQLSELQARIQALQSRIRPHFLFNSMNIIASLIGSDPETAEQVVEDLSELFRASLNEVGNEIKVMDEITLCRRYVRIEQLRLGERLKVEWDVDNELSKVKIPMLTLQPLMENAIYHGIQPLEKGGVIKVSAVHKDGMMNLRVENPVPAVDSKYGHQGSNKMALNNIGLRLKALYGEQAHLKTERHDNNFLTWVAYPYAIDTEA